MRTAVAAIWRALSSLQHCFSSLRGRGSEFKPCFLTFLPSAQSKVRMTALTGGSCDTNMKQTGRALGLVSGTCWHNIQTDDCF